MRRTSRTIAARWVANGWRTSLSTSHARLPARHSVHSRDASADDEWRSKHVTRPLRLSRRGRPIPDEPRGKLANLAHRLADGGEGWVEDARHRDVVEAHDRDILRHAHPPRAQRGDRAEREQVALREDRGEL